MLSVSTRYWIFETGLARAPLSVAVKPETYCDFFQKSLRFTSHVYYYYATTRLNESHISGTPP